MFVFKNAGRLGVKLRPFNLELGNHGRDLHVLVAVVYFEVSLQNDGDKKTQENDRHDERKCEDVEHSKPWLAAPYRLLAIGNIVFVFRINDAWLVVGICQRQCFQKKIPVVTSHHAVKRQARLRHVLKVIKLRHRPIQFDWAKDLNSYDRENIDNQQHK